MATKGSSERVVYQVADTDDNGILIDLLGHTLNRLTLMDSLDLRWSVFDLDWIQREDGILHWERVCEHSRERPCGWQLDDNGIGLFHAQCVQVIDGLFLAGSHHATLATGQSDEFAIVRSKIALQAFDTSFWRLSCNDQEVAQNIIGDFKRIKCHPLVVPTPTGAGKQ
jgi:hypothetical protein